MSFKFIHAKSAADIVDPGTTLGIEITVPETAALCGLGNLDGQHAMPDTPDVWRGKAAIQIALDCDLPPDCTLATSRPDLDSVGAMAILVLRSLGLFDSIDRDLVRVIAERDSFRPSAAWQAAPLPTEENPWPRAGSVDSDPQTAHLGMICSPRRGDFSESLSLSERVFVVACALAEYCDTRRIAQSLGVVVDDTWRFAADVLAQARRDVFASRLSLVVASQRDGAVMSHDSFVVVRVAHAGALGLGYCVAPVVVAFDQTNAGKVTIAAYGDGYLDARGLTAELNRLEAAAGGTPQWGGPRNMCSSPQVPGGTRLSETDIIDAVQRFVQ